MSGKAGRSGRRPKLKDATKFKQQKAMEAQLALRRLQIYAKDDNNRKDSPRTWYDANVYVYEAEYGRPHLSVDQRIQQFQLSINGDDLAKIRQQRQLESQKFLDQKDDDVSISTSEIGQVTDKDLDK